METRSWTDVMYAERFLSNTAAAMHTGGNQEKSLSLAAFFSDAALRTEKKSGTLFCNSFPRFSKLKSKISAFDVLLRMLGSFREQRKAHSVCTVFSSSLTKWGLKSAHTHAAEAIYLKVPLTSILPKEHIFWGSCFSRSPDSHSALTYTGQVLSFFLSRRIVLLASFLTGSACWHFSFSFRLVILAHFLMSLCYFLQMLQLFPKALLRNSGMAIVLTVDSLSHLKAKAVLGLGGFAKGLGLMATESKDDFQSLNWSRGLSWPTTDNWVLVSLIGCLMVCTQQLAWQHPNLCQCYLQTVVISLLDFLFLLQDLSSQNVACISWTMSPRIPPFSFSVHFFSWVIQGTAYRYTWTPVWQRMVSHWAHVERWTLPFRQQDFDHFASLTTQSRRYNSTQM